MLPIFAGIGRLGNSCLNAAGVSSLLAVPGLSLCDSSSNGRKLKGQALSLARALSGYLPAAGALGDEELPWVLQGRFLCSIRPPSIFPNSVQAQGVRK